MLWESEINKKILMNGSAYQAIIDTFVSILKTKYKLHKFLHFFHICHMTAD